MILSLHCKTFFFLFFRKEKCDLLLIFCHSEAGKLVSSFVLLPVQRVTGSPLSLKAPQEWEHEPRAEVALTEIFKRNFQLSQVFIFPFFP